LHVLAEGRRGLIFLERGRVTGANLDRRVATSQRQLLEGFSAICDWDDVVLRLVQPSGAATAWKLQDPMPARTLALQTMRAAVNGSEASVIRADLGDALYHLTDSGEALVRLAALRPQEAAVLFWLRRGVRAEELVGLPTCGMAGYRFLWMLKLLGAASPRTTGSYPLLLRKRRELRNEASAHALLDLPAGAGGRDARLALRKLVRDIHPDRFGDGAPLALRRASGEIVTALVEAEARIASRKRD
jgi:hypothetical protein